MTMPPSLSPIGQAPAAPSRSRRGVVFILVLWICLALAGLAVAFGHSMMLEHRAAANSTAGLAAAQAVQAAGRYVRHVLQNNDDPGRMPDLDTYEAEAVEIGDAQFWILGRADDNKAEPVFALIDEASKLNLNTATREMLEALPRMTPNLAASIIDWRDSDSDPTPDGVESDYYLRLATPYTAKNSAFETVDELRLVAGADWDILTGEDTNHNGVLDAWEESTSSTNHDARLDPGIFEYLTVYTREPNRATDGAARTNINSNRQELQQLLTDQLGAPRANAIMAAAGFTGPQSRPQFSSTLHFYYRGRMTVDEFAKVDDRLTTSNAQYLYGLVNVNTAPAAVLTCLPGIGPDYADKLVAYRLGKQDELRSLAWVTLVLDQESALRAASGLTVRTYQVAADVVAVGPNGHGLRRGHFVFDLSGSSPVIAYYRDDSALGWPLGPTLRAQLAGFTQTEDRTP